MKLHLEILPKAQREFWKNLAGMVPAHFVLYGGTAVALRLGHRHSVDFDFFSDKRFNFDLLSTSMPALKRATTLERRLNTLIASMSMPSGDVKLSFFGGLAIGRVGEPDPVQDRVAVASPLDLLATKLKALHDRIEAKDYLDIEALLKSGLTLSQGIAAATSLFGRSLNPLDTAKAVGWFRDGGLDQILSRRTMRFLAAASGKFEPGVAMPVASKTLAPKLPSARR
jgi:hypothetical protein